MGPLPLNGSAQDTSNEKGRLSQSEIDCMELETEKMRMRPSSLATANMLVCLEVNAACQVDVRPGDFSICTCTP